MNDLKNNHVLVAGFSMRSGVGAARLLSKQGAFVSLWDEKPREKLVHELAAVKGIRFDGFYFGREAEEHDRILSSVNLIVISPGVPMKHLLFRKAEKKGIKVISEVELAWICNPCQWICVTGTDGKTTTTTLLGQIFKDAGKDVIIGGNIGNSLCDAIVEKGKSDFVVAELSSFQLESIDTLRPKVSVILNITPDHLDRYSSLAEYAAAKFRITMNQKETEALVYKSDDARIKRLLKKKKPEVCMIPFSRTVKKGAGAFIDEGYFCHAAKKKVERVFPVAQMNLIGEHNKENILAAIATARFCGIPARTIAKTLLSFKGVPHRTERCGHFKKRSFINDSKATTLNAVKMALLSQAGKCILLMGGKGKGDDYRRIEPMIRRKVKTLVLFGEEAKKIASRVRFKETVMAGNLADAVKKAYASSEEGDVILLSPGCTSYDEFNNFEERGDSFKMLVRTMEKSR